MSLSRLAGLEMEYAIRFSPERDAARPSNEAIFEALALAVGSEVHTRPGQRQLMHRQRFTQNGGSLYYDAVPGRADGGLVEAGSPECRGPSQLLLYQRAHDTLLTRALPRAELQLRSAGFPGRLGLLKNCRDGFGNIYGAQENYDVELARGRALLTWRVALALLLPLLAASVVLTWALLAVLVLLTVGVGAVALLLAVAWLVVPLVIPALAPLPRRVSAFFGSPGASRLFVRIAQAFEIALWWPVLVPFVWLARQLAFRRTRDGAEAFLLTRALFSGAGTLDDAGQLHLSEKGVALARMARATALPAERVLFDCGNLAKSISRAAALRLGEVAGLFRRRQRLQLGLADANAAQHAEFLKLGATLAVLDLAEAGALADAPRLLQPAAAHRALIADPTLRTAVATRAHGPMTALDLQRWYLAAVERAHAASPTPSLEARQVLRLWRTTLDTLATDPERLIGRVDWVTKRWLLAATADDAPHDVRKKVDLRYHELGDGYFAELERAGLAPRVVTDEEVAAAIREPPEASPAWLRGRLVARLAQEGTPASVSWSHVRVGRGLAAKVVRLDTWRAEHPPSGPPR